MARKSVCFKVPKQQGEKALVLANKLKMVDHTLEIQRDEYFIYIPLANEPSQDTLETLKKQVKNCEVSTHQFPERKKSETSFIKLLEDKLPPHAVASLPRAMDFVGDIGIVEIPSELGPYRSLIGEAILKTNRNVRTVLAKAGVVDGIYRLREFSVIAGEPKTETIHKEYGCQYYLDVAKVYFSPRLSFEHKRVASLVSERETVVDLFTGVGPFAIQIAKTRENVKVYAIDMNPYAVEFLKRNIRLNRVEGKVYSILGDAKQVVEQRLLGVADRVIMNLPEKAMEFVDTACAALKPTGGTMHFYCFVGGSNTLEDVRFRLVDAVQKPGRKIGKFLFSKFVRGTAPYEWQTVLDVTID
jgi:tRNA (guanine37-N1)-methyltransferase